MTVSRVVIAVAVAVAVDVAFGVVLFVAHAVVGFGFVDKTKRRASHPIDVCF